MVQIVPLGSLTLLKRPGALKNMKFEYKYYVELFCLAKVMPKIGFLASVGGFWPVLGAGWARDPVVGLKNPKNPQNLKIAKKNCKESFDPIFLQASQGP